MTDARTLKLGAFFHPTGHHVAAWMDPRAQIDAGTNFRHYVDLALAAERARFDFIFLADASAIWDGPLEALKRWPQYAAYFEPITLLSGIAAATSRIGLVATATTSYNEPFNLARRFASLDHISGGRAGWNVVTSGNEAEPANFGEASLRPHGERYKRAHEFVVAVKKLWDSFEDDAFVRDRASQTYFLPEKLHVPDHRGEFYASKGPLHMARSPQGYPVIVQASASADGQDMVAEMAELVFSHQLSLASAQASYQAIKQRAVAFGRAETDILITPGLSPVVGRTREEAEEKHAFLQSQIHPDVGLAALKVALGGFDLSGYPLDGPLPAEVDAHQTEAGKSTLDVVVRMARAENLSIRELYQRFCGARGQRVVVGTGAEIADQMEEWFVEKAVDGFLIQPPTLPGGLDDFVEFVLPELRRRKLVGDGYQGKTLRDHLGLKRPANQFAPA